MKKSNWFDVLSFVWLAMGLVSFNNPIWLASCIIMSAVYGVRSDIAVLNETQEVCDAPGNDDLND